MGSCWFLRENSKGKEGIGLILGLGSRKPNKNESWKVLDESLIKRNKISAIN